MVSSTRLLVFILLPSLCFACVPSSVEGAEPGDIVLGKSLVIPRVGRYGRTPLHTDAIEAEIVAGKWEAPRDGDQVTLPDGSKKAWISVEAKNGAVENPALGGGYLYWQVPAKTSRVVLLEASGHTVAYVNGEPRTGDPYQNGSVRLPVLLKPGNNDFLFQCGRGRLQAKLVAIAKPALIDTGDQTLPDYVQHDKAVSLIGAIGIINATDQALTGLSLDARSTSGTIVTQVPALPPLSRRKVPFTLPQLPEQAQGEVTIDLVLRNREGIVGEAKIKPGVRKAGQTHKRTFVSSIDGSVQYFGVVPAVPGEKASETPGLVLTLHGASVEGIGQANAYAPKSWCHIVAPTNRRPFGFDWEDWGRLDALEVLEIAKNQLHPDPRRIYLTGHSMGGHGSWQLGVTFPDHFAAIAPSAGWISFATYAGGKPVENPAPTEAMLQRATASSDTLTLVKNLARDGVYVLHGDADDNVPVTEARAMREQLGKFHPDFAYYEQPGAGHWWGNACVDWPPLFEFLNRHKLPKPDEVRTVDFVTASPRVSPRCDWAEIDAQQHALRPSAVHLSLDREHRKFSGSAENVGSLGLDVSSLPPGKPIAVELDGKSPGEVSWPAKGNRIWLSHEGSKWSAIDTPSKALKGPHRYGPFKDAFRNHMLFVYGTGGTPEENAWSYAKARFDAETFWYRGNSSVELRADSAFDPAQEPDRNIILYGNADNNRAWSTLLGKSPVQVHRGGVRVGDREEKGDDLACLFVRPRADSDQGMIGIVAGTGLPGLRLTDRIPYFVSGVGYPDCIILGTDTLSNGAAGIRGAGFFGMDWGVPTGDWAWTDAKK